MPRRNGVLATNEKYHIFNRTVGTEIIFLTKWNLRRIIDTDPPALTNEHEISL